MNDFLTLMGGIVRAYANHHHPEMLDDPWETDIEWFNLVLSGWWVVRHDMGWAAWLGVYSRCPARQDLDHFPFCDLDAPLPNTHFIYIPKEITFEWDNSDLSWMDHIVTAAPEEKS